MANSLRIELKGVEGLKSKLFNLVGKVRRGTEDTVAETLLLIESDAKQFAPVDTGRLRSSIHTELAPNRLSGSVEVGVSYGIFLEFGTRYQRAQPFLFPAYEKNRAAFVARLKTNTKLF